MTTPTAPADGITLPAIESTVVNDACWKFIDAMPHELPGGIFNGLKPAIYAALMHYHAAVIADRASPSRADGWISVADRLPEAQTEVLVAFAEQAIPSTGQYTGSPHDQGGWCYPSENRWTGLDGADPTITHWMPLPAAPGTATVPAAVDVGAAQAETAQAAPICCQCPACAPVLHASDCAVHNAPALPVGPCNCGAASGMVLRPAKATKEMMVAAVKYANGDAVYKNVAAGALEIEEQIYGEIWEAMVAATPGATHGN